jgi:hypothetical protein
VAFLDKVKFWKKDDFTLDMGKPADQPPQYDLGAQRFENPQYDPLAPQQEQFGHEAQGSPSYQQYPVNSSFPGAAQVRHTETMPTPVPEQVGMVRDQAVHPRDVELILAKLDAIKSEMDALHQRVRKIEQGMDNSQQKKYW